MNYKGLHQRFDDYLNMCLHKHYLASIVHTNDVHIIRGLNLYDDYLQSVSKNMKFTPLAIQDPSCLQIYSALINTTLP